MQSALRYIATPDEFVCPPDGAQTWLRPVGIAEERGTTSLLSLYRLAAAGQAFARCGTRTDTGFDVWRTDINSYLLPVMTGRQQRRRFTGW